MSPEELNYLPWGYTMNTCNRQDFNLSLFPQSKFFTFLLDFSPNFLEITIFFCLNFCSFKLLLPPFFLEHYLLISASLDVAEILIFLPFSFILPQLAWKSLCFCMDLFCVTRRAGLVSRFSRGPEFGSHPFLDTIWASPLISLISFPDLERRAGSNLTQ